MASNTPDWQRDQQHDLGSFGCPNKGTDAELKCVRTHISLFSIHGVNLQKQPYDNILWPYIGIIFGIMHVYRDSKYIHACLCTTLHYWWWFRISNGLWAFLTPSRFCLIHIFSLLMQKTQNFVEHLIYNSVQYVSSKAGYLKVMIHHNTIGGL